MAEEDIHMEYQHSILAEIMHYGIAIDSGRASGWKIAAKSKHLSNDEAKKVKEISSVGSISETWPEEFENGYGYFGIFKRWAVFAHYYKSSIPTPRGRYFVPRDILLVPAQNYINELDCDPGILFDYFPAPNQQVFTNLDTENPTEILEQVKIPLQQRSLDIQLKPLRDKEIPQSFLKDFLTCVLQPDPKGTMIWWPRPDPQLLISLLALIPPLLRENITFCTCVADPADARTRIKVVNEPTNVDDSSLIIIKDDEMTIRQKMIDSETRLPGIIIRYYLEGIDSLNSLHRYIKANGTSPGDTGFSQKLRLVEEIARHYDRKMDIHSIKNTGEKYNQLRQYFATHPGERPYVLGELENGLPQIFDYGSDEAKVELQKLLQEFSPLYKTEIEFLTNVFFDISKRFELGQSMDLFNIFSMMEELKVSIKNSLFERLSVKDPGSWSGILQFLSILENSNQFRQLEQNTGLVNQLKNRPGSDLLLSFLELIFSNVDFDFYERKDMINTLMKGVADSSIIIQILLHLFKIYERRGMDKGGILLLFITVDAHQSIAGHFNEIETYFQRLLIKYYFSIKIDENSSDHFPQYDKLIENLSSAFPGYAAQLEALTNRCALIDSFKGYKRLLDEEIRATSGPSRAAGFFQSMDTVISIAENDAALRDSIFLSTLTGNKELVLNLYNGFLEFLRSRPDPVENDLRILYQAIMLNCHPLKNSTFFKDVFSFTIKKSTPKTQMQLIPILLKKLRELLTEEKLDTVDFFSDFMEILRREWAPREIKEVEMMHEAAYGCFGHRIAGKVLKTGISKLPQVKGELYPLQVIKGLYDEFSVVFADNTGYFDNLVENIHRARQEDDLLPGELVEILREIRDKIEFYKEYNEKMADILKKIKKI